MLVVVLAPILAAVLRQTIVKILFLPERNRAEEKSSSLRSIGWSKWRFSEREIPGLEPPLNRELFISGYDASKFPATLSGHRDAFLANNPILLVQDNDPRLMEDGFFWGVMRKIHDRDAIADRAEVSCGTV